MKGAFGPELERLKEGNLLRKVRDRSSPQGPSITLEGRECLNFSSNDYLGLANHPALREAALGALEEFGTGAGASRLLSGGCTLHRELEEQTAALKGAYAALLFSSGYAANTGAIPALAGEGDAIFSDSLNHASIIDGCRLSRAEIHVFRHRDMGHLDSLLRASRARRKVVITDTVFSMDGDLAPLPDLYELCPRHGALLYLDDAHGTGVLGEGRGALAHFGLGAAPWVVQMGTFSKALGSFGGFAAAEAGTIEWLTNSARSFIFSTALPPPVVAASLAALSVLREDRSLIERLWRNRRLLWESLSALGLRTGASETPIIPVMLDSVDEALALSRSLLREGIYAPAVRPPTVSVPRLRLTVTANHAEADIERLALALKKLQSRQAEGPA